jgi:hypothetical protein
MDIPGSLGIWDGWPPNSMSKRLFSRVFDFSVLEDAPTTAPSNRWLLPDVAGPRAQALKRPTLVIVRRGTCSSTPNFHTETGHIREMLKVIRDQSHTQGYRV